MFGGRPGVRIQWRQPQRELGFDLIGLPAPMTPATTRGRCRAWLGHKNIQHTVRYTELAPDRFKNFWRA
jgi:hypothetical protein